MNTKESERKLWLQNKTRTAFEKSIMLAKLRKQIGLQKPVNIK
jgi:hypothetical protein